MLVSGGRLIWETWICYVLQRHFQFLDNLLKSLFIFKKLKSNVHNFSTFFFLIKKNFIKYILTKVYNHPNSSKCSQTPQPLTNRDYLSSSLCRKTKTKFRIIHIHTYIYILITLYRLQKLVFTYFHFCWCSFNTSKNEKKERIFRVLQMCSSVRSFFFYTILWGECLSWWKR